MESALERKILEMSNLNVVLSTEVLEVVGKDKVEALVIQQKGQEPFRLNVDAVFLSVGWEPDLGFLEIQVEKVEGGYVKTDTSFMTSVEGLFAAGDIRDTDLRQIITACADGARAAYCAFRWLSEFH
jgi:thioredoxin reductase (NADPH)